jgi:predicted ester cyclase
VIRWSSTGTHNGVFMGIPPTGKPTTVTGIDIFRIAGGKLVELWQNWDQLGLLQQIGAIPAPGQAGT